MIERATDPFMVSKSVSQLKNMTSGGSFTKEIDNK